MSCHQASCHQAECLSAHAQGAATDCLTTCVPFALPSHAAAQLAPTWLTTRPARHAGVSLDLSRSLMVVDWKLWQHPPLGRSVPVVASKAARLPRPPRCCPALPSLLAAAGIENCDECPDGKACKVRSIAPANWRCLPFPDAGCGSTADLRTFTLIPCRLAHLPSCWMPLATAPSAPKTAYVCAVPRCCGSGSMHGVTIHRGRVRM